MSLESKKSSLLVQLTIFILFALGPLTGNVILVLFSVLSLEFSVIPNAILIAIPSFMFPFALVQLFSGAISDIKGRFPVILLGLSIFGIGMIIATISFSLDLFVIANVLAGIGFGFVNPVLIALLTDITPGPHISKKIGLLGAVANLGVGFGPLLAGLIIMVSWRYLYIIFVSITVLGILIILTLRKRQSTAKSGDGIRIFFSHLAQEIRRLPVILLVLSAFLLSHTSIATIIWTSRSFTHVIPEEISGVVIALFGIMGFLAGIQTGLIIKKKSLKLALMIGVISLFIANIVLVFLGNNSLEALPFTTIGLLFMGFAGGILMTSVMFYSQTLSVERRGALAGLTTAFQFIGIAFVPTTLEPFFNLGGISLVYVVIFIISIILVLTLILLYKFAKIKN
ncbi:MAG: MFS transporter [Promethearchaeota archaeon]|jgi:DHA1 family bicyclomycin/chloramphenicol resistance-like MFS transporter